MNIYFSYTGHKSPILEIQLELIKKHVSLNDNVSIVKCESTLDTCFWNPRKKVYLCKVCKSTFENGMEIMGLNKHVNILSIPLQANNKVDSNLEFSNVDELISYKYNDLNIGRGVASRLISLYRDHRFDTIKFKNQITKELNSAIHLIETLKFNFLKNKPDLVYIFNGRITTEQPIVLLCKSLKINFKVFEVAYTPNRYLLRDNSTSHSIESFTLEMEDLWSKYGNRNLSIAHDYFINRRENIKQLKIESFTSNQKRESLPSNFDFKKKNIAIFNSTIDEYAAIEGWDSLIYQPDETQGIKELLESFKDNKDYFFYVRVHPHMSEVSRSTSQLNDIFLIQNNYSNVHVIWPEEKIDSYKLLDSCDIVVTFSSTMGVEAAYWGKPTILLGRALYENLDCIYKPRTHEEAVNLLKSNLEPLNSFSALKYANREIEHGIDFNYFRELKEGYFLMEEKHSGHVISPNSIYIFINLVYSYFVKCKIFFMKKCKI
jgi:hypothetical protein